MAQQITTNGNLSKSERDTRRKLTHQEQEYIKQWIAEDWGYIEVLRKLKERFNKEVNPSTLTFYSHYYEKEISEIRKKLRESLIDIPISSPIIRQMRREEIFRRYLKDNKLKEAREVLNEAREEVTPTPINVGAVVNVNQNNNGNGAIFIDEEEIDPERAKEYARIIESRRLLDRTLGEEGHKRISGVDAQDGDWKTSTASDNT